MLTFYERAWRRSLCSQSTPTRHCIHSRFHGRALSCVVKASGHNDTSLDIFQRWLSLAAASLTTAAVVLTASPTTAQAKSHRVMSAEERATIEIYRNSIPSVVSITNLAADRDAFTMNMMEVPQGRGTGFVWDSQGHIITNYHVIRASSEVMVALGKDEYVAEVVGVDKDRDIAVLKVKKPAAVESVKETASSKVPPLCVNTDIDDIQVGQKVYAIGNPFGLEKSLTTGVVSNTGRDLNYTSGTPLHGLIQTDAAVFPGNSGGPLLDSSGCVIGVNTGIYSPSEDEPGLGFAIPSSTVATTVNQILTYGRVVKPVLGIFFASDNAIASLGFDGVMVSQAREGGPAWKAGILGSSRDEYGRLVLGDIIRAVNGTSIRRSSDLYRVLDKSKVGDTLDVEVLRGSETHHVDVQLESDDM